MRLTFQIMDGFGGIILGRDWLRTKGNVLWHRGKPAPEPPAETLRAVASCFSGEKIETLVVHDDHGSRAQVTFVQRDKAALTIILPFAEVDRLIAQLQGARALVNEHVKCGNYFPRRSSRHKLQMYVQEVNEETVIRVPKYDDVSPLELGLFPQLD